MELRGKPGELGCNCPREKGRSFEGEAVCEKSLGVTLHLIESRKSWSRTCKYGHGGGKTGKTLWGPQ